MKILLTNDDGIDAISLTILAEELINLGFTNIIVVAPKIGVSGVGRMLKMSKDDGIITSHKRLISNHIIEYHGVTGSPALSVAHALFEILIDLPDVCISGINKGENIGRAMQFSGTIGAAMEAAAQQVPAFSLSLENPFKDSWSELVNENGEYKQKVRIAAKQFALYMHNYLEVHGSFKKLSGHVININYPSTVAKDTPKVYAPQSKFHHYAWERAVKRDFTKPYLLPYKRAEHVQYFEPQSDIYQLMVNRNITFTALSTRFENENPEKLNI